jgi:hypothetical protein
MTLGKEHGIVTNTFNKYIADIQELRKQGDTFIQRVVLVFVVPWKDKFPLDVSEWEKVPKSSDVAIDVGVVELLPRVP